MRFNSAVFCLIMELPVPEATLHLILMFRLEE